MSDKQRKEFAAHVSATLRLRMRDKTARFRVSAFQQRDMPGMVLRRIETQYSNHGRVKTPPVLERISHDQTWHHHLCRCNRYR